MRRRRRSSNGAATCKWKNGTHSHSTVEGFLRPRPGAAPQDRPSPSTPIIRKSSPPRINGATPVEYVLVGLASCLTAGIAAVAQHRNIQLRSVTATIEGDMDIQGILGIDSDVRNGFGGIKVTYDIDADANTRGHRGAGGAIAEALGGLRHRHQPDQRHGRGELTSPTAAVAIGSCSPFATSPTVIIGAGHAGLAMSRCLTERSIDHVVLERGEVAHSWRTERWDSLRLLTPNWQSRLPGFDYEGDDPDGYRTMPEVIDFHRGATRRRSPRRCGPTRR